MQQYLLPPLDHVPTTRTYIISNIIPFGARIVFERVGCSPGDIDSTVVANGDDHEDESTRNYVRVLVK